MKIFHDFDSDFKENEYKETVEKYGKENVILIERSFAFWFMRGIIPFFIFLSVASLFGYISYLLYDPYQTTASVLIGITIILTLFVLKYMVYTYLDYKHDFTIVTKGGIYTFKQLGFFNSKAKDLPANKIRSIEAQRLGILGNIFSFGNVVVITDGSMTSKDSNGSHIGGKTKLTYINHHKQITKDIMELCLADR